MNRSLALILCAALTGPALAAEPPATQAAATATTPQQAKPICKTVTVKRKQTQVCRTQADWDAERARLREEHRRHVRERQESVSGDVEG